MSKQILHKDKIVYLLSDIENQQQLFDEADKTRFQYLGNDVYLRGLIEFSNICRNNCLYCGIRRDNINLQKYRMSPQEIIETAKNAATMGFKTIVMQSAEDITFNSYKMCKIIEEIKKLDVAVTLSIGERDYADYKAFREAGADRYLMRIETTDKNLYHKLNPNMSWQHRYECLLMLKELGYELGSGIMVGLPEQTIDSIADDLLFLYNLGIDMAGIGPFIPHPQTPLKNAKVGDLYLALRTIAIMRIMLKDINIPATTAIESLHPNGCILALKCGANVIMPNITNNEYRKLYILYPGKPMLDNSVLQNKLSIVKKITSISRTIGNGYGGHKKY